jgi:hypothetical protein
MIAMALNCHLLRVSKEAAATAAKINRKHAAQIVTMQF